MLGAVIVVNPSKCYACLGCVVECAYRRTGADASVSLSSGILTNAACEVVAVGTEPVPLVCNQCEEAPCSTVCITGALHRESEDTPVALDAERCIGCKACVIACPFGMVRLHREEKAIIKCDLCSDRLSQNRLPACVEACPTGALELKELDDVVAETQRRAGEKVIAKVAAG